MIYVTLFLSAIFASVGFIVTKTNAKFILSGYNTMSEAERANVDIDKYLKNFKRFHIILGLSLFVGTLVISLINNNWASIFMTTFPLLAYSYLVIKGLSFAKAYDANRLTSYLTGGILIIIAFFIGFEQLSDFKSSELILSNDSIEIKGSYGTRIKKQDVLTARLVDALPPISYKQNGFAAGDYAKGSFKIKNGQVVRMFVNKNGHQFLYLHTTHGDVYYNADERDMKKLEEEIIQWQAHD